MLPTLTGPFNRTAKGSGKSTYRPQHQQQQQQASINLPTAAVAEHRVSGCLPAGIQMFWIIASSTKVSAKVSTKSSSGSNSSKCSADSSRSRGQKWSPQSL